MVSKPDRADAAGYSGSKSKSSPKGLGTAANSKDRSFDRAVEKAAFNPGLRRGTNMPYTKEQQREFRQKTEKMQKQLNIERFKDQIRTPPPGMNPPRAAPPTSSSEEEKAINRTLRDMQDNQRRQSQPKAKSPTSKVPGRLNVEPERPPSRFKGMAPMMSEKERRSMQFGPSGQAVDLHSRSRMGSLNRGGR